MLSILLHKQYSSSISESEASEEDNDHELFGIRGCGRGAGGMGRVTGVGLRSVSGELGGVIRGLELVRVGAARDLL